MLTDDDLRESDPRGYLEKRLGEMMETTRWEWREDARSKFMEALDLYIAAKIGERLR